MFRLTDAFSSPERATIAAMPRCGIAIPASGLPPLRDMAPGSVAWNFPATADFSRRRRPTRPCVSGIRAHGGSAPSRCAVTVMKSMRWHSLRTRRCSRREAKMGWSCSGTRARARPQGAGARSLRHPLGKSFCPIARHCWQSMMSGLYRLSIWRRYAPPLSACPRQDPRLPRPIITPFLTEPTPSELYEISALGARLVEKFQVSATFQPPTAYCPRRRMLAWRDNRPGLHIAVAGNPARQVDLELGGREDVPDLV